MVYAPVADERRGVESDEERRGVESDDKTRRATVRMVGVEATRTREESPESHGGYWLDCDDMQ